MLIRDAFACMDCFPDARNPLSCRRGLATSSSSTTALLESTHNPSGMCGTAQIIVKRHSDSCGEMEEDARAS
jgi:hypothetical protein